jgi:hypothetical protein
MHAMHREDAAGDLVRRAWDNATVAADRFGFESRHVQFSGEG